MIGAGIDLGRMDKAKLANPDYRSTMLDLYEDLSREFGFGIGIEIYLDCNSGNVARHLFGS